MRTSYPDLILRYRAYAIALVWILLGSPVQGQIAEPVSACAIRWDAWYTNGPTDPGSYVAKALSQPQWHSLAPLHAKIDPSGGIEWAASQQTFDAEIRAAHDANLCWVYVMYGKDNVIDLDNPLMKGLVYHQRSAIKAQVSYAMMTTTDLIGRAGRFEAAVRATVQLMEDSDYKTVLVKGINRPLLFLLYNQAQVDGLFNGSLSNVKEVIDSIRKLSLDYHLGNPYFVIVQSPAKSAEEIRVALGADAISEYVAGKRKGGAQAWSEFEPSIEADWDTYLKSSSKDVIPTLRTGADIRARCQTPPPYDRRFKAGNCSTYVVNPTNSELKIEFQNAVDWVASHRDQDPAKVLLVYSWSECDESGNCLMPTIGDPTGQKLKVLADILKSPFTGKILSSPLGNGSTTSTQP